MSVTIAFDRTWLECSNDDYKAFTKIFHQYLKGGIINRR